MVKLRFSYYPICLISLLSMLLIGCNTGIESTKQIKMSRDERREVLPTAEDLLSDSIFSLPLAEWIPGKEFIVVDNKVSYVLESEAFRRYGSSRDSLAGHILRFDGIETRPTPGEERSAVIRFKDGEDLLRYNTSRSLDDARLRITGIDLPMMIDLDMVALADSILRNRTLWIKTPLWYDAAGEKITGRKFIPVKIARVRHGDMIFPLIVDFSDDQGLQASIYLNVNKTSGLGAESRTLPTLFSLSDPKKSYPGIIPEVWDLIQRGEVRAGMTKEECKLALGNPADVVSGFNWNKTVDMWTYKDGTFLQFEDGLLVQFRH
ncbi:MAG: hypothetical protein ACI304_07905 [Lepagella sp.]